MSRRPCSTVGPRAIQSRWWVPQSKSYPSLEEALVMHRLFEYHSWEHPEREGETVTPQWGCSRATRTPDEEGIVLEPSTRSAIQHVQEQEHRIPRSRIPFMERVEPRIQSKHEVSGFEVSERNSLAISGYVSTGYHRRCFPIKLPQQSHSHKRSL